MTEMIKSDIQGVDALQNDTAPPEVNQANVGEFQTQATLEEAQAAVAKQEAGPEATHTARNLRLRNVQFEDSKGKHSRYGVRSLGPGKGFGILDKLRNSFLHIAMGSTSRSDCYSALLRYDEDVKEISL